MLLCAVPPGTELNAEVGSGTAPRTEANRRRRIFIWRVWRRKRHWKRTFSTQMPCSLRKVQGKPANRVEWSPRAPSETLSFPMGWELNYLHCRIWKCEPNAGKSSPITGNRLAQMGGGLSYAELRFAGFGKRGNTNRGPE